MSMRPRAKRLKRSGKGEQVTHSIKRRARDRFGRFLRDDPKTPENEAYVDVKVDKDDKDEK